MISRAKILDIPVDLVDLPTLLSIIKKTLENNNKLHIVTVNAEIIMLSKKNKEFKDILIKSNINIPDGSGVVWALRRKKIKINKLAGIDLVENCIKHLTNARIFLFGTEENIISKAFDNLNNKYKNNNLVGYRNGFFTENQEKEIINYINSLNVDILFVGLGVPKQETWIKKNINKINAKVFVGVGGSFDVFSGKIKRAPKIMIKLHLEWLYRLYKEPWRWKRMLALPYFVFTVLKEDK
jgi:N-acetylglucosaminyldiphosphoundecaprenol N-acetyl-beta-D-mannosaminyltransferase